MTVFLYHLVSYTEMNVRIMKRVNFVQYMDTIYSYVQLRFFPLKLILSKCTLKSFMLPSNITLDLINLRASDRL